MPVPDVKIEPKPAQPEVKPAAVPAAQSDKAPDASAGLPEKVRIAKLHGYFDENHRYREWHEGDVVSDPAEVSLLISRQAPLIDVSTDNPILYEKDQPAPRAR